MPIWCPISPHLDPTTGAFTALKTRPRSSELVPVDRGDASPFASYYQEEDTFNASLAFQLGITAMGNVATSMKTQTIVFESFYYTERTVQTPIGGLITGTRWGAGFRLRVAVTRYEAHGAINLASVAGTMELGLCNASFEIDGFGFASPEIVRLLPPPGRFDGEALKQILSAAANLRDRYASGGGVDHRDELLSLPLQVQFANDPAPLSPLERSRSVVFAMRQIQSRASLNSAKIAASERGLVGAIVTDIYERFAGIADPSAKPTRAQSKEAATWLDT